MASRFPKAKKYNIGPILEHFGIYLPSLTGYPKIRCPFPDHPDEKPSATVDFSKQRVNCWACGRSEDAVGYIMKREGLGFEDAVALAESVTGESNAEVQRQSESVWDLF